MIRFLPRHALCRAAMATVDDVWLRHANPASASLRMLTPFPLLALAVRSRVWLGWAALLPVASMALWIWLNPRLFAGPTRLDTWSARGALGERVPLRLPARAAEQHRKPLQYLTLIDALGIALTSGASGVLTSASPCSG